LTGGDTLYDTVSDDRSPLRRASMVVAGSVQEMCASWANM